MNFYSFFTRKIHDDSFPATAKGEELDRIASYFGIVTPKRRWWEVDFLFRKRMLRQLQDQDTQGEIMSIVNDPTLTVKVQRALLRDKYRLDEETIETLCPKDQVRY